ncbi:23S rRNA (guanine(745)-N(1))-methyltransferase [Acerihabitans arboris]|uniref:23S rRNA (Guanine(745)-N(1))-methyltransferase n=1 Tax=Acerihabitans arboris TaxID=2691583 RepID=A0A845SCA9_9GAMM|nr:23S rRNA (guanine(745)-N(1))-methyltransferase [Acerihabitans arboris]NDL62503.1 23S rRNA (guanine(745)-N(1))-methyltransferase [Acerihabitans arboris]
MSCYQCPLCHLPLARTDNYWSCAQRHRYDCAREGYVNLLPVQFKRSKVPGDNQEMMRSRRAFLDAGYYQPMRDRVMSLVNELLPDPPADWLDIGCGEGYYTERLAATLAQRPAGGRVYGLDIAKTAVRLAAKRYPQVRFCVASSQRLPFTGASLGGILRIYAPCNPEEMYRTLQPGGLVVTVAPGPRHLYQLKAGIYPQVALHPLKDEHFAGFTPLATHRLGYSMDMTGEAAGALLQMTPFAWRATPEVTTSLTSLARFTCETDFIIRAWRREP